ncbi:ABC transporter ATP-binding protein [Amycolatopsis sp.]|uniref:ABC transporter ATP-binding protein n=1 Tax=Amycolatopsis sp. TaxID=37632 RepID=UPI002D0FCBD6|nr:ATP-binding cassette domain-containing protein [Amycolatopsis sp.]HVV08119.1 ATP-binding cassette domain-containing protein [Amycolatopsis sp.]
MTQEQLSPTPATQGEPLLEVRSLAVRYPNGAHGVRDVSLTVHPAEIVTVLGRNGAGKTSLLRGIAGFLSSEHVTVTGRATVAGHDLTGVTPMRSFRHGVLLVPERDKVFANLTVEEHLRLATRGKQPYTEPCAFPALDRLRPAKAGLLSGGERQMLALEVAWRNDPRLLLVDEASLGLAPVAVKELMERLRVVARERGTALIAVEQDASVALRLADRAYVINHGEVVWEGTSAQTSAASLAREYLGTGR